MHHGKPVFTTVATHLIPPNPPPPPQKKVNGPKTTSPVSVVFLSQVILVWGSSLTSCKRQKPRPDEIEVVMNLTHSVIWKCLECRPGSGMSIPCGTSVAFGISINCVNCVKGVNYSDTSDYSQCKSCRNCSPHEKLSGNCATTEDASSCLEICSKGFYWNNVTNACDQCSDGNETLCVYLTTSKPDYGLSLPHIVLISTVLFTCGFFALICVFCVMKFSLWTKFKRAIGRGSQGRTELTVFFKNLKDDDDLESISVYRSASYAEGADNKRILTSG